MIPLDSKEKVLIYGVGLMGASLALSLKSLKPEWELLGVVKSTESKDICLRQKLLDRVYTEEEFLYLTPKIWEDLNWIIFGTPVHLIKKLVYQIPIQTKAIITDLGSTKESIVHACENYFSKSEHHYVSSHPMCGSENSGPEHAIPNLFQGKLCIITPLPHSSTHAIQKITQFWKDLGMVVYSMDAVEHDRVLAYLSHAPHILSSLMALWATKFVGKENSYSPMPIMGGGFRDMLRIAGSNPTMWSSILQENKKFIIDSLVSFQEELNSTIQMLQENNPSQWEKFFNDAKKAKNDLLKKENLENL